MRDKQKLALLALIAVVFAACFIGVGLTADNYQYFLSRRVPKVLAMVLAGIAVAQASLVFQTITNNRILTPSIMGFDSLYVLTQTSIVMFFGGMSALAINHYLNFAVSIIMMVIFSVLLFGFYFQGKRKNLIILLLAGLIIGQLFGNISSFFTMVMDPNEFSYLQGKLFASFNNIKMELVYLCTPVLAVAAALLFSQNRVLDVLWLDRDNAISLGVDVDKFNRKILIFSALLIAISTALIGPVMFFGLLVTNLTREWFSTYRHKVLLIACSLMSICALLGGQWIVEKVLYFETTLNVVINFVGGIYFLSMLLRNKVV
ncbi:iron chelate uptake ABC transporter family permease subunit [Veronia pacifica]|uniref:ABC transporter permease n=1 Tax=Veronia pacifica TaxID=1080227 RepID=A0A1C3EBU7_9GAMM|nr:iron chelate uptake ABC transporter family permease subunit [Veronia pacifica]ODA30711.1 ABC transporter permease [Veronia pacifica]